jgi:hypothetical protein
VLGSWFVKVGCFGCFVLVVGGLALLVLLGGAFFLSSNIFGTPEVPSVAFSRSDGYSAQQKLYEIVQRQAGRSSRKDPISLTEAEANAFLSRHLDEGTVPLSPIVVRFKGDQFVVQGQTALRNLVQSPPLSWALPYLPSRYLNRPIWVSVEGRITIEGHGESTGRSADVTVNDFALGRQPISPFFLYALMGPSGRGLFHFRVPGVVESIDIQGGRAVIRTR